ncbi:adenylate/guanylate cyclase domain-containing protein [Brevibacillus fluminis]|uniref:Adenylate/guanylate cyclase domain-containing protein n=1 Tax=Brevibacillus fluminis TaxID=511487 RepID=A0A3M8D3A5_9BACL|nr:adenylate/guanylate cyclase domain-containing protein [Brevibacillus fluminis]RNB82071.1 adenylate/guanylate cyclase domain-containing protein [Brevibacillus fluminis]
MVKQTRAVLIALLITLVVGWLYHNDALYNVEVNFVDRMTKEIRTVDSRIVIVGIDDDSLSNLGQWPWPRSIHAELIKRIEQAGAKAIGLDLILSEPSQDPADDAAMQDVLKQSPNVVMANTFIFPNKQEDERSLKYDKLLKPVYDVGEQQQAHINVFADRGDIVRQILLGVPTQDGKMLSALSVRLANYLLPPNKQITFESGRWKQGANTLFTNQKNQLYFAFAQPPGGYTMIPYFDALNMDPETMEGAFKDAIVLIGPYSVGLGDQYLTPTSNATKMYGVEIHANMVQSLQDSRYYQTISGSSEWIGWALLFILSLLTYLLTRRVKPLLAFVLFLVFFIGYAVIAILANVLLNLLLPFTYPILAIIISYVISIVNRYLAERKERSRVTSLFSRYVSQQVVDEILSSQEAQNLGGTRKNVTLMFVDIRGFTPLSERIEPEEVIQVLNEYLDLCTQAVFAYEGTLDKFIGDGVMAIFGAPIPLDDHPVRAVRAALQMKKGSAALAERLTEKYGYSVSFGIGLNSGDAVIGNIGAKNRLDYTAIGDTVNMAARLESNAKPGQVLISQSTYDLVKELFEIEPLGEIKVKGKEKPVAVYQVMGEKEK